MTFDDVRINMYVRFTEALDADWPSLSDHRLWEHEPLNCIFLVTNITCRASQLMSDDDEIELDCVKGCGGHLLQSVRRDVYDRLSVELGREFLVDASSMTEFNDLFAPPLEEEEYNLELDTDSIYKMIQDDRLPLFRRQR